jgi:DNA-binding response OmpR family regulator
MPLDIPSTSIDSDPRPAILVVEDDEMVLDVIVILLKSVGYRVLPALSQDEALRAQAGFPGVIALLLTDMRLKQGSGVETARGFLARRPGAAVIYMSGYPWEDFRGLALLRAQDAFLSKPFDLRSFVQLLGGRFGHLGLCAHA